ncbi:MAG: hypothetical protein KDJ36_11950 [Hyphomicrobiaceae bacterium]|nr:hypothetical protein [Hyphomicrobiaceae bacterium]
MSQPLTGAPNRVEMSPQLRATLQRASEYARQQAHRFITVEHVLLALNEDPEASVILAACDIDQGRLASDVSNYLGMIEDRFGPDELAEPVMDTEASRIINSAVAASQKSRRKHVSGAIVLAAIIGDGRSAAANMLRSQGLTFDAAIKALQQGVATAPPSPPRPPQQPVPQLRQPSPREEPAEYQPPRPPSRDLETTSAPSPEEEVPPTRSPVPRQGEPDQMPRRPDPPRPDLPRPSPPRMEPARELPPDPGALRRPQPVEVERTESPSREERPAPPRRREPVDEPFSRSPSPAPEPPRRPQFGEGPPDSNARERAGNTPGPSPYDVPPTRPPGGSGHRDYAPQPPAAGSVPRPPFPSPGAGGAPPQPPATRQAPPPGPQHAPAGRPGQSAPVGRSQYPSSPPENYDADNRRGGQGNELDDPLPPAILPRRGHTGEHVMPGQLQENIPRRMRSWVPVVVQVRIARAEIANLGRGMEGNAPVRRHDIVVTKAMSVRLRAPEGGFFIETGSPETQWIENHLGVLSDDFASWRWTVTPQRTGKARLQLIVSARTVGADGMVAETALPDQVVNVTVSVNYSRLAQQWGGWVVAAVVGGVLAKFGEQILALLRLVPPG